MTFEELTQKSNAELEALMQAGKAPALEALAGHEYRGWNVPFFTRILGIQKFIKGFFQGPGGVEGYNIPVRQNGLDDAWTHLPSAQAPKRFGYYLVGPVSAEAVDHRYPNALLLDYGASPRNAWYHGERVLRDYLVEPCQCDPELLLGKAYLALGPRLASNFFILKRLRPTDWRP